MTWEAIQDANRQLEPTDIKGKPYVSVNQRIKGFRMVYPDGFIETQILSNEGGVCIIRAECGYYVDGRRVLGTGTAYEKEGSSFINSSSYIENCETSAIGRALGMAGFGIETNVASADEVQNAELNQVANEKIDDLMVITLRKRCEVAGVDVDRLCKLYKVKSLEDLTMKKLVNINEHWDKIALKGET